MRVSLWHQESSFLLSFLVFWHIMKRKATYTVKHCSYRIAVRSQWKAVLTALAESLQKVHSPKKQLDWRRQQVFKILFKKLKIMSKTNSINIIGSCELRFHLLHRSFYLHLFHNLILKYYCRELGCCEDWGLNSVIQRFSGDPSKSSACSQFPCSPVASLGECATQLPPPSETVLKMVLASPQWHLLAGSPDTTL